MKCGTMISLRKHRQEYLHQTITANRMDNLASLIDRLFEEKRIVVRRPENLSWGSREYCEGLFCEVFRRVDKSIVRYRHLREYAAVIDWMTSTAGRGLLLYGDCGRGKSVILTGVVPVLLAMKGYHTVPIHADDQENLPSSVAAETRSAGGTPPRQYGVLPIHRMAKAAGDQAASAALVRGVPEARPAHSGADGRPHCPDQSGRSSTRLAEPAIPLQLLPYPQERTGKTITIAEPLKRKPMK